MSFLNESYTFHTITTMHVAPTSRLMVATCMLTLAGLFGGISGCSGDAVKGAGPSGGGRPPAAVRVSPVIRKAVRPETSAVGTIIAKRTSIVASGADGKVNQFLVREGDIVEEGQELSILNMVATNLGIDEAESVLQEREQELAASLTSRPEEIAEAKSRMEAADVTRRVAAQRLARFEQLVKQGATNADSLDEAQERSEAAEKLFAAVKSQYELILAGPRKEVQEQVRARRDAQQHQVDFLKAERDKRTAKAPFRGVIVKEHTESGQWLSKGDAVVTVADLLDEVQVIALVNQSDLANVQIGSEVTIRVEGIANPNCQGIVEAIIPRSEWLQGSRSFPVKIQVKNSLLNIGGRLTPMLNEGMLAQVTFFGPEREATLVPKDALIRTENGARLYVMLPGEKPGSGKAKPIRLQEGGSFGEFVELLGEEVQPGMNVIVEGGERLTPFADVMLQAPDAGPPGSTKPTTPKKPDAEKPGTEQPEKDQPEKE
ncbi:MAG: efflux RND transporter periplasmic adaptor subunit [Planctomycetaceae bacterium]